jgi:S1-C subfamily serine protease
MTPYQYSMNMKLSQIFTLRHQLRTVLLSVALLSAGCLKAEETVSAEASFPLDETTVADAQGPHLASYADVLDPARSAVVSVTTASIVEIMRNPNRSPIEDFLRRYYGMPETPDEGRQPGETFERRIPNGLGSGVIISADGYILTNNHVISTESGEPADEITSI